MAVAQYCRRGRCRERRLPAPSPGAQSPERQCRQRAAEGEREAPQRIVSQSGGAHRCPISDRNSKGGSRGHSSGFISNRRRGTDCCTQSGAAPAWRPRPDAVLAQAGHHWRIWWVDFADRFGFHQFNRARVEPGDTHCYTHAVADGNGSAHMDLYAHMDSHRLSAARVHGHAYSHADDHADSQPNTDGYADINPDANGYTHTYSNFYAHPHAHVNAYFHSYTDAIFNCDPDDHGRHFHAHTHEHCDAHAHQHAYSIDVSYSPLS